MSERMLRGADATDDGDVVELILADHRAFEEAFRALRNRDEDRPARLRELADLLVAHAEAEEREVYPQLRQEAPDEAEDIAHSIEEHAEGHAALLELLRTDIDDVDAFEDALEELVEVVNHHLGEEERDVLNPARAELTTAERVALGEAFLQARRAALDRAPGDVTTVKELVRRARAQGDL